MITTSFFQLFKIGPGPSSSHTVGPMIAANCFRQEVQQFVQKKTDQHGYTIRVELYGALAATGHGHGTHRAVLAGLYGEQPVSVNVDRLNGFFETEENEQHELTFDGFTIPFIESDIFFDYTPNDFRHPNTLKFVLLKNHQPLITSMYYSVGGGFIEKEGESIVQNAGVKTVYPFKNMAELAVIRKKNGIEIGELLLENEIAITRLEKTEVLKKIDEIILAMRQSIERGIVAEGILPGGLSVHRRAKSMFERALRLESRGQAGDALFTRLNAYALATSEENAAGHIVVTAPTNGAAGIIPATLEYLIRDCKMDRYTLQKGMLVAATVGAIIKANASISGAELGCQAEVGAAAAMAAAFFAYCFELPMNKIATAAEIAMEHHLGMTCDPVKGLVQVPCIERNANGVVSAYNAYLLASGRTSAPVVSFDQVVEVMRQTGIDLSNKYKETATGGLATSFGWGNMPGS